jgi:hypothetical protein
MRLRRTGHRALSISPVQRMQASRQPQPVGVISSWAREGLGVDKEQYTTAAPWRMQVRIMWHAAAFTRISADRRSPSTLHGSCASEYGSVRHCWCAPCYTAERPGRSSTLGLKGTMSAFELNLLRQRSLEPLRQKARRGELKFRLPVGFRWIHHGKVELDS